MVWDGDPGALLVCTFWSDEQIDKRTRRSTCSDIYVTVMTRIPSNEAEQG